MYEGFEYKAFASFEGQELVSGHPFYLFIGKRGDIASIFVNGLSTDTFKLWLLANQR